MPDLFRGDPVPTSAMGGQVPGFNMTAWRARHPQSQIEEIIDVAVKTIRGDFNISKVGAVVRKAGLNNTFFMLTRITGLLFWRQICRALSCGRQRC